MWNMKYKLGKLIKTLLVYLRKRLFARLSSVLVLELLACLAPFFLFTVNEDSTTISSKGCPNAVPKHKNFHLLSYVLS